MRRLFLPFAILMVLPLVISFYSCKGEEPNPPKPLVNQNEKSYPQWLDSIVGMSADNVSYFKEIYHYNNEGYASEKLSYKVVDGKWMVYNKYDYEYDRNGNRAVEIYSYINDNKLFVKSSKYEYSYNNKKDITSYICYSFIEDVWAATQKISYEYKYDDNGRIIHKSDSVLSFRNPFDKKSNYISEYKYEDNKIIITHYRHDIMTGKWDKILIQEQFYNENGKQTKAIITNTNIFVEGLSESYTKIEYEYNGYGNVKKVDYYSDNTNSGVWKFDSYNNYYYTDPK